MVKIITLTPHKVQSFPLILDHKLHEFIDPNQGVVIDHKDNIVLQELSPLFSACIHRIVDDTRRIIDLEFTRPIYLLDLLGAVSHAYVLPCVE
jgi:hypothetical protein